MKGAWAWLKNIRATLPVVVEDFHYEADLLNVLRRDVEDEGLVVDWTEGLLFYRSFLLLNPLPLA